MLTAETNPRREYIESELGRISRGGSFAGLGFGRESAPMTNGACHANRLSGIEETTAAKISRSAIAKTALTSNFLSADPIFMPLSL
jgi:hypothetical protein